MIVLVIIATITALISWFFVKKLTGILLNRQIIDVPNDRTLHVGEIPRGGGLVIVVLLLMSIFILGLISGRIALFSALFITVFVWALLSWIDDLTDLSARRRLLFQFAFAFLMLMAFGWVNVIQLTSQNNVLLSGGGFIFSLIGVIWLANLYNFMDGMDGLAASQTIIASATISFWLWQYGDQTLAIVCLVLAASSYGFILFNWHPAKIFMGDVGSVTIGAFFATLILISVSRYELPVISFVILLGVFIIDASITILRRCFRREKFWMPHRSHYYQRLAALGFKHNNIVLALIVLMSVSSLIASTTVVDRDTIRVGVLTEILLLVSLACFVEVLESRRHKKS